MVGFAVGFSNCEVFLIIGHYYKMRRAVKIAKELFAADGEQDAAMVDLTETPAEDIDDEQLQDLILELIQKIYSNKTKIKMRGTKPIKRWLPLNSASTVKDCLTALSLIS